MDALLLSLTHLQPALMVILGIVGGLLYLLYIGVLTRRRPASLLKSSTMMAAFVASVAGFIGIGVALFQKGDSALFHSKTEFGIEDSLRNQERVAQLEKKFGILEDALRAATEQALRNPQKGIDLSVLAEQQRDITVLKESVKKFEGLLLSDAEKLLTLPLLKRDMDVFHTEITSLKTQMELQTRILQDAQGQGRWIIGTLGFGILALLVPIFKSSFGRSREEDKQTTKGNG